MAPQSRIDNPFENTILHSRTLVTRDDFGGPAHTSRHFSEKRYRHGIVTSRMEHATNISPSNKLDVLFVEQENKDEHSLSGEMSLVPNPVPDTGFRPTQARPTGHSVFTVTSALPTHLLSIRPVSPLSTFVPLPPLLSLAPITTIKSLTSSISTTSSSDLKPSKAPAATILDHETHQLHKLPTPVIILLAVGSGLLLAGIFIILKVSTRPTRRQRPTPSLPILNDSFSDYGKFTPKDSPIFGGTEKTSPLAGNNSAVWSWTPYTRPEPAVSKPSPTTLPQEKLLPRNYSGQSHYPLFGHVHTPSVPLPSHGNSSYISSYRPLGRAERRSSAPSMSPYFSSPRNSLGTGFGNSGSRTIEGLTIDGRRDVQRTGRKHVPEVSSSIYAANDKDSPLKVAGKRHSQGLAYDGAVVSSPSVPCVVPQTVSTPSRAGRTRIKSTYFAPGSYPRNSNLPTKISADRSDPMERRHKLSIQKSQSRRDRDTQALTYALGLSSPVTDYAMSSPQPTLYPDDSLSVVESRSPNIHSHKKQPVFAQTAEDLPSLPKIVTDTGGSAALGSLMLMDFGAEPTVNRGMSSTKPLGSNSTIPLKKTAPRNDGKPPRVPSPPPLPSLAQMALEHANPQAYADYKSPTYSIYGLYEHDRKSGTEY